MKEINIFGTSEKIMNSEEPFVEGLLNSNVPSLGINTFVEKYPNVTYWLFYDPIVMEFVKENYRKQKLITHNDVYNKYFIGDTKYTFETIFHVLDVGECRGNSGLCALWWAVNNGFDKINLYGVLDSDLGYEKLANGNYKYYNAFTNEYHQDRKIGLLKELIENGFNGRAEICQPLKSS
jgi:hypothetical protein